MDTIWFRFLPDTQCKEEWLGANMREVEARRQGGCREVGGEWRLSLVGGQDGQQMVGKLNWKSETWNPP